MEGRMPKTIYDDNYRELVAKLKTTRLRLNLTQTQAGKLVGRSRSWQSKVETFELRLDVLGFVRLCRALGLEAWRLCRQLEKGLV